MTGCEHPILDPGAERFGIASERAQCAAEGVVFGVGLDAFLIRPRKLSLGMCAERRQDDVVDEMARYAFARADGSQLLRRNDALRSHDDLLRREDAPTFFRVRSVNDRVAEAIGDGRVEKSKVGTKRCDDGHLAAGERVFDEGAIAIVP